MSDHRFEVEIASRKVTGKIFFEKPDGFGFILGYYPEAFTVWRGAIHEMYDPSKPAGKVLEIIPHPEEHAITLISRVSQGVPVTWHAILDESLTAYGVSCFPDSEYGYDPQQWPTKAYQGKTYPYLPRYTVTGISYIDKSPFHPELLKHEVTP